MLVPGSPVHPNGGWERDFFQPTTVCWPWHSREAAPASKPTVSMLPFRRDFVEIFGEEMEEIHGNPKKPSINSPFTHIFLGRKWIQLEWMVDHGIHFPSKVNGLEEIVTVIILLGTRDWLETSWDPTKWVMIRLQHNQHTSRKIPNLWSPKMSDQQKKYTSWMCFFQVPFNGPCDPSALMCVVVCLRDYYVFHCLPASSNPMEADLNLS